MSLKSIELQIAIPKTFDAGKLAEQKQQRIQVMQEHANMQTEKQAEKDKETVLETEHYEKIKEEQERENEQREKQQKKEEEARNEEGKKNAKHPYKGSFVDFSG